MEEGYPDVKVVTIQPVGGVAEAFVLLDNKLLTKDQAFDLADEIAEAARELQQLEKKGGRGARR